MGKKEPKEEERTAYIYIVRFALSLERSIRESDVIGAERVVHRREEGGRPKQSHPARRKGSMLAQEQVN